MSNDQHLSTVPVVRWFRWLMIGLLFGLGLGFVLGLARPRVREH